MTFLESVGVMTRELFAHQEAMLTLYVQPIVVWWTKLVVQRPMPGCYGRARDLHRVCTFAALVPFLYDGRGLLPTDDPSGHYDDR